MIPSEVQIIEEIRVLDRHLAINVRAIIDKRDEWEALYRERVGLCEMQEEVIRDLREMQEEVIRDLREKLAAAHEVKTGTAHT